MLNGRAGSYRTPDGRSADDEFLLIILNAYHDVVPFTLPPITGGVGWRRLLDTTDPELRDDHTIHPVAQPFSVPGRSLGLFICQPA
jgi:glycogen operon protein